MRTAIMQPYFFPYLGYFQLINAVDNFVIYDDVQYIKGGWINKNRILLNENYSNIGIPVRKDSYQKNINERYFVEDASEYKSKVLRKIENAYRKAPFFDESISFIYKTLSFEELNICKFNSWCLVQLCSLLKIKTKFLYSSEIIDQNNSGEARVIGINQILGTRVYINSYGGLDLYQKENFQKRDIELCFLKPEQYSYKQFGKTFTPDLSIIDLLMFNSSDSIIDLLNKYHLE